ncbi:UDP-N-acetylmuramoyl-tripeptide--D-alanyl-D-alanine ligase, partial [Patescibacteria group bacterium]|nr:UDP-N-acetylmuramoyl-tripeptide--D-alanyl-D-alanine ligase [Patescibacteria group bacterium]
MKAILLKILKFFSTRVIKKYKPTVIGITGSIGKTTTKHAINEVLKNRYRVGASVNSFNTEIGLPITILGLNNSKSIFVWIKNIFKSIKLLIIKNKNYPEILILEMGADKIGDISYLISIVKPNISILTNIAPVHVDQFKSLENIYKEKIKIFDFNDITQKKIVNIDNDLIRENLLRSNNLGKVITYGTNDDAMIRAYNIEEKNCFDEDFTTGIEFDVAYNNSETHVRMQYIIGKHQVYSILAAFAVGILFDLRLDDIKNSLEDTRGEKGRMSLIKGIKNTWIIDDTYNSSPVACKSAIETLSNSMNLGKKI